MPEHHVLEAVLVARSRAARCAARRRPRPRARAGRATVPPTVFAAAVDLEARPRWTTGGSATGVARALAAHVDAVAGVAQARRGDLARVDRAEREALLELRAARQRSRPSWSTATLCPSKTSSSWPPTVLHEHDRGEVVDRALDEHALAAVPVADAVGRGRQVHDHLRAGQRLRHRRRPRLPDVLADRDADRDAVELEDARLGARLEVALLVEHAVVRQVHLAVDRPRPRRRPAPPPRCRRRRRSRGSRPARRCPRVCAASSCERGGDLRRGTRS